MCVAAEMNANRGSSGPVLFAIPGPTDLWGWRPGVGLVKIRSPFRAPRVAHEFDLSVDGSMLYYSCVLALPGSPRARFSVDLLSGHEEELELLPASVRHVYGRRGQEFRVEYSDWVDFRATTSVLLVHQGERDLTQPLPESEWVRVPFDDTPFSTGQTRALQFSPDGQRIAVSFDHGMGEAGSLVVVDLPKGHMIRNDGFVASGSNAWSPDSRCLIGEPRNPRARSESRLVLYDVDAGQVTPLPLDPSLAGATVRGWLDSRHVLLSSRKQRVITVHAADINSGLAREQVTFRLPLPSGSAHPWLWAPQAVAEHPHGLERRGR
jgi:hypothetical protein